MEPLHEQGCRNDRLGGNTSAAHAQKRVRSGLLIVSKVRINKHVMSPEWAMLGDVATHGGGGDGYHVLSRRVTSAKLEVEIDMVALHPRGDVEQSAMLSG